MESMQPPPKALLKPITVPSKTLLGPGPSNAPPRVLAAGAMPVLGHLHPEFTTIMDECKAGIQYLFQTTSKYTLAVSGTGHAAMEMACSNMVEEGDKVLIAVSGLWGQRFQEMTGRQGGVAIPIEKPCQAFTLQEIEEALEKHTPSVMFIAHSESSCALMQPMEGLGALCHRYNCLLIVDCVASAGGTPIFMDRLEIDVLYTGSQKCLGCPPGVSPISFSERAWQRFAARKAKPTSYYMDLGELANYWACDGAPARRYHHTAPITTMYMLREGLALLAEETLEKSWQRHLECAQMLWIGLEQLGLELFVKEAAHRLPTLTSVVVPPGIDWKAVVMYLMKNYRIEISGGLGPTVGKIWRIGLMGYNSRPDNVHFLLRALKEALEWCRTNPQASL